MRQALCLVATALAAAGCGNDAPPAGQQMVTGRLDLIDLVSTTLTVSSVRAIKGT
jgi:hypothetical protein